MSVAAGERGALLELDLEARPHRDCPAAPALSARARRLGAVASLAAAAALAAAWLASVPARSSGPAGAELGDAVELVSHFEMKRRQRMDRLRHMGAHRWGVNIHFTGDQQSVISALAKGFKTIRVDLFWHKVERSKTHFDFTPWDQLLASLKRNGVQPVFILCYGNKLYGCPNHPNNHFCRHKFANYAQTAMRHFKGEGIIWELYNEPNGFWAQYGRYRAEVKREYPELVMNVMKRVRSDPEIVNEIVIGPATSGVDIDFITACTGALKYLDGISVHPYRRAIPESVMGTWSQVRSAVKRNPYTREMPLISSEWGWATCWSGKVPKACPAGGAGTGDLIKGSEQAARLARMWLIHDRTGIGFSIWYDWQNDGDKGMNAEHNFGVTYKHADYSTDPTKFGKPAYLAAVTLQSLFGELNYVGDDCKKMGNVGIFCLRYRHHDDKNGHYDRFAVWTIHSKGWKRVSIKLSRCMRFVGLLGNNISREEMHACPSGKSTIKVRVSSFPVFLVPEEDGPTTSAAAPTTVQPTMVAPTVTAVPPPMPTPVPTAVPAAPSTSAPVPAPVSTATSQAMPAAPPTRAPVPVAVLLPAQAAAVRFLKSSGATDMRADRLAWLRSLGASRWGVGVDVGTFEPGEEAELAGGFSTARVTLSWAVVEAKKGSYNFSMYDGVVGRLQREAVTVVASLCCGNALYGCDRYPAGAPECPDAYVAYAKAAISHFRGKNVIWEVFDEPNTVWADGEGADKAASQYALLLDALGQKVRLDENISSEILVGPSTAGIDTGFIAAVGGTSALTWLDGISVKPTPAHADADGSLMALAEMAQRYAPDGQPPLAMLSTSSGWPACSDDLTRPRVCNVSGGVAAAADPAGAVPLEEQAARLARQWLVHDACNVSVSLWSWWKDGGGAEAHADNYGVVLHTASPLRPKPAYLAAVALKRLLGRKTLVSSCSSDPALRCLAYASAGGVGAYSYAVWSVTGGQPRGVALRLSSCLAVVDMTFGQSGQLCPGGEQDFVATTQPQYLVPCEESPSGRCEDALSTA